MVSSPLGICCFSSVLLRRLCSCMQIRKCLSSSSSSLIVILSLLLFFQIHSRSNPAPSSSVINQTTRSLHYQTNHDHPSSTKFGAKLTPKSYPVIFCLHSKIEIDCHHIFAC